MNSELFTQIEIKKQFFQDFIKRPFKMMNTAFPLLSKFVLVLEIFQFLSFFCLTSLQVALDFKISSKDHA